MPNTDCLRTTVRNNSGRTMKFSFLPPHGRELEADEEISFLGSPMEAILSNHAAGKRHLDAFERAVEREDLVIVSTPNPILYDDVEEVSRMLVLSGETLATAIPCWSSESESVSESEGVG